MHNTHLMSRAWVVPRVVTSDPAIWSQWGHRTLEYWRHNLKYLHNSGETDQLQILADAADGEDDIWWSESTVTQALFLLLVSLYFM